MTIGEFTRSFEMQTETGEGWIGRWSPGIGDPTIIGWLTVVLYLFGAWQSYRVAILHNGLLRQREGVIWWIFVYGLLALGFNKQLDLQSAFTELGRILAAQQGWYEKRREVQVFFMYGVAALATSSTFVLAFIARKAPFSTLFAITGSVCLLSFILIRAGYFYHLDLEINSVIFGLRMNWILEMGGICIIIVGARLRMQIH